ncbi:calcium-binding protein, putative, partial [Bodo saltans]
MASAHRDEFLVARSLLQGGSPDASSGITEHAMRRFVVTVVPDISSSAAASATAIFGRFARNHPQGNLAVDDLKEYLSSIAPLMEINWADMCHSFVTETFLQTFRLLTEDSPETPGSGASGAHHASATTTSSNQESNITTAQSARKEDVREFLEGTQCADGRPLSATVVDISKFLSDRGRRNDVYQDDFIALLSMIIRDRPVDPTVLAESITERRKQRREGKKKAMEKIKAAMSNHLEDGMLGAELRAAASPPRRRALSPYAFGSWKLNQGAVHHVSADGEVARPAAVTQLSPVTQANPTYQPVIPIPSPRDRTNAPGQQQQTPTSKGMAPVVMKPLAIPQHQQQQQAGGAGGSTPRNGGGMTNFSFSEIPMINVETTAPAALSTTASTTTSYDFSAHNAIDLETFALLDVSEGGSISLDAVYELCAAFPNPPQPNAIRRVFHLVDVNASNDIDREEFEQLCFLLQQKTSLTVTDMCKYYTTAMYRRLFELLDEDGDADASVSREELRVLLEAISPILNATFSSNDVFRLTKEYETDQLNFPQFQNVVKQLIRGRSISKVVGAFEEVLRRRRLLKRQALEKFANASSHHSRSPPPHNTSGKKLPPPPSGPPPAKVCHNCSIQARRIIELEDQLAVVVAQRDQLEKEKKLLHMNKSAAGGTYSSAAS